MRASHCLLTFLILTLCAAPASADRAQEVLSHAKKAAGGAAVDAIHTTQANLSLSTGGLTGTASSIEDNVTGHYLDRFELGPVTGANGFDGKTAAPGTRIKLELERAVNPSRARLVLRDLV